MNSQLALDDRTVVADTTARDAIASGRRYEGLKVWVIADQVGYRLVGGITNSDWVEDGGSGTGVTVVADTTARDAIDAGDRTDGMLVYTQDAQVIWRLRGGILDVNWVNILSPDVFGTRAAPRSIVASSGIVQGTGDMSTYARDQVIFVEGDSAGENDVSANPQIEAGTFVGQTMTIIGRSNTDFIKLESGNGLDLNGDWYSYTGCILCLVYDGTNWTELWRRDA